MLGGGIVRGQQCAPDAVGNAARQINVDPESNVDVDLASAQFKVALDQHRQTGQVILQLVRRNVRTKPVQDVFCLVEGICRVGQGKSAGKFADQLVFHGGRKA